MEILSVHPGTEVRSRFCEKPPETLSVTAAELWERLPREYRLEVEAEDGVQDLSHRVELPCGELFRGNTPRLPLGVLQELLPGRLRIPEHVERNHRIPLPPGWLATRYRLVSSAVEPAAKTQNEPRREVLSEKQKEVTVEREETQKQETEVKKEVEQGAGVQMKKPGFFAALPTFYRHAPSSSAKEVPVGEAAAGEEQQTEGDAVVALEVTAPPLERLWKLDAQDQFVDPAPLQALFMTDEKLTLERVVTLAGELPGLRACVLVHGEQVLCSSTAPTGMDLRSLSGQAMNLLSKIRESSTEMGLGSVPAITLHAEQGVLSFLYEGELCLLVLHADRAFVPGVRERLQQMLGHLSQSQALPGGASAQQSLGI